MISTTMHRTGMFRAISAVTFPDRIFHILPDKPYHALMFARDALDTSMEDNSVLEISLLDGSVQRKVPPPEVSLSSEIYLGRGNVLSVVITERQIDFTIRHNRQLKVYIFNAGNFDRYKSTESPTSAWWKLYEIDIGRTAREKVYMFNDRLYVIGELNNLPIVHTFHLDPDHSSSTVLKPIATGRINFAAGFPYDAILHDLYPKGVTGNKLWVVSLRDSRDSDGSLVFMVDLTTYNAQFVDCLPDTDTGSFPGPREKYAHVFSGNRMYLAGGLREAGASPFDCWELTFPEEGEDTPPIWLRLPVKLHCTMLYSTLAISNDGILYAIQPNTFLDSALSSVALAEKSGTKTNPWSRIRLGPYSSIIRLGYTQPQSLFNLSSMFALKWFPKLMKKTETELKEAGFPNFMINLFTKYG